MALIQLTRGLDLVRDQIYNKEHGKWTTRHVEKLCNHQEAFVGY